MKYYANYKANNGTCFKEDLCYTNKAKAIKEIREIANGNRFAGNECKWYVFVIDEKNNPVVIASGGTNRDGTHYPTPSEMLPYYL